MSLYGIEESYFYGNYRFDVCFDSGSETGLDQRDIEWREKITNKKFTDGARLRSFYFEEVREKYMRNFCKKFADDADYRQACLDQTTDWAIRNALFDRNIGRPYGQESLAKQAIGDEPAIFQFLKKHWQAITSLPDYQRIQAIDTVFDPTKDQLDPEIKPTVEAFNLIPGVKTRFSCQGVTSTVKFQNIEFLVVSPHARLAYITFEVIPPDIEATLIDLVSAYPSATYHPTRSWSFTNLESSGDNLAFRKDAVGIAQKLLNQSL